jgi:Zn-dependent peptidase ImmA (M78 family)
VVLITHKHDQPGRVAFLLAHEAGHIAAGDCDDTHVVVDAEEDANDDSEIERNADLFARRVLVGADDIPILTGTSHKDLATEANELEGKTGVGASTLIFEWASRTKDYKTATLAVQALYLGSGARRHLRTLFDQHVDTETASESDRSLLRCIYGDPEADEGSH